MRAILIALALTALAPPAQAGRLLDSYGLAYQAPLPNYQPPARPEADPSAVPGYESAPLPSESQDQRASTVDRDGVSPMLFRPRHQYRGEAYLPGSSAESAERRGESPGFGLSITQPMQ